MVLKSNIKNQPVLCFRHHDEMVFIKATCKLGCKLLILTGNNKGVTNDELKTSADTQAHMTNLLWSVRKKGYPLNILCHLEQLSACTNVGDGKTGSWSLAVFLHDCAS